MTPDAVILGNVLKRCPSGMNTKEQFKWLDFELVKQIEVF